MSEQFSENDKQIHRLKVGDADVYSSRMLEVMRYNRLRSSDYHLVMTILRAITHGQTEEQWKEENQRTLKALLDQPANKTEPHADANNRFEQAVTILKDLNLWPW
jgi:hypothetical protein